MVNVIVMIVRTAMVITVVLMMVMMVRYSNDMQNCGVFKNVNCIFRIRTERS